MTSCILCDFCEGVVFVPDILIELSITFLGAFLGFISAMILERGLSKKRRKEFVDNIIMELDDIRCSLSERTVSIDRMDKDVRCVPSPFAHSVYIPIWEAVLQNGDIISLRDESYYDDLISIYGEIKHWIMCENWLDENAHIITDEIVEKKIDEIVCLRNDIWNILYGHVENQRDLYELILKNKRL